jgi:hypothetical protein
VPKVDGFFSLTPREADAVLSLFYTTTNASYPRLEDFLGVSQITAPDQIFRWQSRSNFLPLVTAGQKPVFLDEPTTLSALVQDNFDGQQIVLLPAEAKPLVVVTNQAAAKILSVNFKNHSVDIEVEAAAPVLVVVAQTFFHDWIVTVDGKPTTLLRANMAFQAVQVPAGRHQLHFFYRDRAFEIGAGVAVPAWLICFASLIFRQRRRWPSDP